MSLSRKLFLLVFGFLLLTQFNNCGGYNNTSVGLDNGLAACNPADLSQITNSTTQPNTNCATPDATFMTLQAGGGDQLIGYGEQDFSIGGFCNDGGYSRTVITWQLKDSNNTVVRTSSSIGANASCVGGQFILYVYLPPVTSDAVDRSGLYNPNALGRAPYTLDIVITGYDNSGLPHQNPTSGMQTINLNPI